MRSKDGVRIYRHLRIRIIAPAGEKGQRLCYTPPASRNGYTEAKIAEILEQVADELETKNPRMEFRIVELAPDRFNFIYAGEKQAEQPAA